MTLYSVEVKTAEGWVCWDSMFDPQEAAKLARFLRGQGHEVRLTESLA